MEYMGCVYDEFVLRVCVKWFSLKRFQYSRRLTEKIYLTDLCVKVGERLRVMNQLVELQLSVNVQRSRSSAITKICHTNGSKCSYIVYSLFEN